MVIFCLDLYFIVCRFVLNFFALLSVTVLVIVMEMLNLYPLIQEALSENQLEKSLKDLMPSETIDEKEEEQEEEEEEEKEEEEEEEDEEYEEEEEEEDEEEEEEEDEGGEEEEEEEGEEA